MTSEIVVAILALCGTVIGSIAGIMTANRLTLYRVEQLEHKMDKHNQVVERVALLEADNTTQWKRIDELRAVLDKIKEEIGH